MTQILLVGVGGFLGAVSRLGFYRYISSPYPFATFVVNVLGCIAVGLVYEYFHDQPQFPEIVLFFVVGFLGSFTTFSAFSYETINLVKNSQVIFAILNIFGNVLLCLAGVVFGGWLGRILK